MPDNGVSPTITASRSLSQRGTKRLRVKILKTRGAGGVKDIWEDCVPGARGLCRETHGVEVVGVLAALCPFPIVLLAH